MSSRTLNRLRWATKLSAHHLGLLALLRRTRRRERSLVLRYHAVAPDHAPLPVYAGPDITIPRGLFAAQMRFLKRAYTAVPLATIIDAIAAGQSPPAGTVAVTLDDGYADNYQQAYPVLRALAVSGDRLRRDRDARSRLDAVDVRAPRRGDDEPGALAPRRDRRQPSVRARQQRRAPGDRQGAHQRARSRRPGAPPAHPRDVAQRARQQRRRRSLEHDADRRARCARCTRTASRSAPTRRPTAT